jgi:OOP family OmpA-OmpF porin
LVIDGVWNCIKRQAGSFLLNIKQHYDIQTNIGYFDITTQGGSRMKKMSGQNVMNGACKTGSSLQVMCMLVAVTLAGTLSGCANLEVNSQRGNIPGYYIRTEMQEADRAVEAARSAGKDKMCPAEFKAAEAAKDNAYDVFRACHTEEGAALAKAATAKANALCPPVPAPAPAPKVIVPPPAPAPIPPAAPTAALMVTPATVVKGQSATLNWKSQNASTCTIQPGIGPVPPQGARAITPADSTSYDLICSGAGGTAASAAGVTVVLPPPPVVSKAAEKFCSKPAIINVQFDTDKSAIKGQYDAELKTVSDFLKEFPKARGEISGHTDNVGSKAYNDKLSQARADSVKKYIVEKLGISPDRITTKGYGFSKPVASNTTREGRARNRRIEANFTCE